MGVDLDYLKRFLTDSSFLNFLTIMSDILKNLVVNMHTEKSENQYFLIEI